jgi:hypothetical protein
MGNAATETAAVFTVGVEPRTTFAALPFACGIVEAMKREPPTSSRNNESDQL